MYFKKKKLAYRLFQLLLNTSMLKVLKRIYIMFPFKKKMCFINITFSECNYMQFTPDTFNQENHCKNVSNSYKSNNLNQNDNDYFKKAALLSECIFLPWHGNQLKHLGFSVANIHSCRDSHSGGSGLL